MSAPRSRTRWCLLLLIALAGSGCRPSVEITDERAAAIEGYAPNAGPYAINGIRPGMKLDDCLRILGAPDEKGGDPEGGNGFWKWSSHGQITVTFQNVGGNVTGVYGNTLTDRAGTTVVSSNASEEELRGIIRSATSDKHFRPSGSGIIALGRTLSGTSYHFNDDSGEYEILFDQDGHLTGMRAGK